MNAQPTGPGVLTRVIGWLRAGYPQGVPGNDYVALFGVLHRHLTPIEVEQIARQLVSEGHLQATPAQIRDAVRAAAHESPSNADVARVAARLAAGGWPQEPPGGDASYDAPSSPAPSRSPGEPQATRDHTADPSSG